MTEAITDLQTLLASMQPVMREDNYVFAVMRPETDFLPEDDAALRVTATPEMAIFAQP